MAFPHGHYWYVIKHDLLVEKIGKHTNWLQSDSWQKENGGYSSVSINPKLLDDLADDKLGHVYGHVLETDE